ncbi:hypothetical protein RBU49_11620 [Clostridium sp. MB40-C1]|uniref:hypothetical protein n=1 Tax=Clostridium sp. MB40-C1 TaxID=3070996 RepID=UPI0027DECD38|nr:hypothetical protein [Clostridium sp. MB40-C1]WMJ79538.1 hypothetical protein RBU49_11620 [Clostridium sp. MB40-C1]
MSNIKKRVGKLEKRVAELEEKAQPTPVDIEKIISQIDSYFSQALGDTSLEQK